MAKRMKEQRKRTAADRISDRIQGEEGRKVRKFRVILDFWIARIGLAFGWVCLVFWGMISVIALTDTKEEPLDWGMTGICIGLAVVHWLLIRRTQDTKELIEQFRLYSSLIAQGNDTISALAEKLSAAEEDVMKNLQRMCRRGYIHGHVDLQERRLALETGGEQYVARCPGCGATTAIYRTGDACRYCGAPLVKKVTETEA